MPSTALPDPLAELPGYLLRRAAQAMMAELGGRLAGLDMRISDASVLLLVAGRTDMTSSDIGAALDIQRANMVPLLNRLAAAGLIERVPIDRKSQAIVLTRTGRQRLTRVRKITQQFEQDLLARIPQADRATFVASLRALID